MIPKLKGARVELRAANATSCLYLYYQAGTSNAAVCPHERLYFLFPTGSFAYGGEKVIGSDTITFRGGIENIQTGINTKYLLRTNIQGDCYLAAMSSFKYSPVLLVCLGWSSILRCGTCINICMYILRTQLRTSIHSYSLGNPRECFQRLPTVRFTASVTRSH